MRHRQPLVSLLATGGHTGGRKPVLAIHRPLAGTSSLHALLPRRFFLLHLSAHAAGLWRFPSPLSSSHAPLELRALPSYALRTPRLPRRTSPASILRPLCACTVATRFLGISPGRACTLSGHGDAAAHARSGANVVRDGARDTSGRFGDSCLSGSSRLARERSRRGSSWARPPL